MPAARIDGAGIPAPSPARTAPAERPAAVLADLLLAAIALAGTAAAGSLLFAIAQGGYEDLPTLVWQVGVPGAAAVIAAPLLALLLRRRRLLTASVLGFLAGAVATGALEAVRESGFRVFHSMPGDLPMLMGVLLTGRIMDGPDLSSNLAGWGYHVWNGAMFGIAYTVLLGGFPRRVHGGRGLALGAGMGAAYGLALGTGFLFSPVPVSLGVGRFGADFGPRFAVTVYLAHAAFGALLGALTHRFGTGLDPLWANPLRLARSRIHHRKGNAL